MWHCRGLGDVVLHLPQIAPPGLPRALVRLRLDQLAQPGKARPILLGISRFPILRGISTGCQRKETPVTLGFFYRDGFFGFFKARLSRLFLEDFGIPCLAFVVFVGVVEIVGVARESEGNQIS
ncbi:hypothetical protein Tco_0458672 [Tanacetum coccineum]